MSNYVELFIDQGEDYSTTIVLQDDATNAYQNVAGYVLYSSIRKSTLSENASGNLVCSITDAANGKVTLSMNAANTSNMKPGNYLFDVKYVNGGLTKRLIEGLVIVSPSITR